MLNKLKEDSPMEREKIKATPQKPKILLELAWEVCNQVGGIYTVIRTKVPSMVEKWGENYFLIGPYFPQTAASEFEPIHDLDDSPLGKTIQKMRQMGLSVHYGYWLITGKPRIVLLDFAGMAGAVNDLKAKLWKNHQISTLNCEELVNNTIAFGEMIRVFMEEFTKDQGTKNDITAHFHEWMAGLPIMDQTWRGDFLKQATLVGPEMRGSSPVRTRSNSLCSHPVGARHPPSPGA